METLISGAKLADQSLLDDVDNTNSLVKKSIDESSLKDKTLSTQRKVEFNEKNYIERYFKLEKESRMNYGTGQFVAELSEDSISELQLCELKERVIILSGITGIGKSTLLPSLCAKIKMKEPQSWIEIIKLSDHIRDLQEMNLDNDSLELLSTNILKYDKFTDEQFKKHIKEGKNTVIMFDGLDGLSSDDEGLFRTLNRNLVQATNINIWITTHSSQPQYFSQNCSYHLMRFSENNKIEYLRNYWNSEDKDFVKKLITNLEKRGIDVGIPLYAKLSAEYLLPSLLSKKEELPIDLTITELYSRAVQTTGEVNFKVLSKNCIFESINSIMEKEPSYYHRSFAEYHIAQCLFKKLSDESSNIDDEIIELLLTKIIVRVGYEQIRIFLNGLLGPVTLLKDVHENLSSKFLNYYEKHPERVWMGRDFIEINILELIYKSIRLFNQEKNEKFREYFPPLFSYIEHFSKNLAFLEKALDENSKIMQQKLDYPEYFRGILKVDSISSLDIYLKALEKQISNEKLENFLTETSMYSSNRTFLFNLSENCCDYFLNYLKVKLIDFKSFLIFSNDLEDTFWSACPPNAINWVKQNMDEKFYDLCLRLSIRPLNLKEKEEKFIYNFNEIAQTKILDFKYCNEMYLKSLRKNYPEAVILTMEYLKDEFTTSFENKIKLVNENIRKTGDIDNIDIQVKVLEFYFILFSSRKGDFMKNLDPPFNLLKSEELELLLSNEIESLSDELKAHLITIGKVGVFLRYTNHFIIKNEIDQWPLPEIEEKEVFKVQLKDELFQIHKISDKLKLKAVIKEVDNQERLRNIMNKIENCFGEEYLLEIIMMLVPEPYSEYYYQNPLMAEHCVNLLAIIM